MRQFSINGTFENIYFSDHDAIRIAFEQNKVDFHTVLENPI